MKIYVDAYLAKNLGDDLFIDILVKRYSNHKFYAISKGTKNRNYENLKVYSNQYIYRALKKFQLEKYLANCFELVVSIGGSMYMENGDSKRDFSLGKNKRFILGSNFGPYKTQEYLNNIKNVFKSAEDVCFREKYSYDLFKCLPNVRYASDIVFAMDTKNIRITHRKRAIISIISCDYKIGKKYSESYEKKMIELIDFLQKKGYEICLMSFCKEENDETAIVSILEKCDNELRNKIETYFYDGNIKEALNVLADSSLIVGSRFHANIIGLLLEKTIIPVIYSDKTKHVLDDMNISPKMIDIRNIENFSVESIKEEDLNYVIDVSKQRKDALRHFEKLEKYLGYEMSGEK